MSGPANGEPVQAEGVLTEFAPGLWLCEGPAVPFLGLFRYPTRMALVRLADGGLWVWSPIPLDVPLRARVDALGPVRHVVTPNKLHHLFLGPWAEAFPQAQLWAPPGLARKRSDLHFAGELGDTAEAAWEGELDQVVFRGSAFMEEVVFLHRRSRTAIVGDLVQRFPPDQMRGWRGALMRLDGLVGERGSTPREWRLSFLRRRGAREARERLLAWQPRRLVIAHGSCASENATAILTDAFRWLGA